MIHGAQLSINGVMPIGVCNLALGTFIAVFSPSVPVCTSDCVSIITLQQISVEVLDTCLHPAPPVQLTWLQAGS